MKQEKKGSIFALVVDVVVIVIFNGFIHLIGIPI